MQNQINTKAVKLDTYPKAEINVALGILQAGIDTRVSINVVDINGKFKTTDVSNDILKTLRVHGHLLYDAFEYSFNTVDKTSILNTNHVNIVQAININAVAANVYSKSGIHTGLYLP